MPNSGRRGTASEQDGCDWYETPESDQPASRGRPRLQMTHRRRQVLEEYREAAQRGPVRLAEIARRCGIADWRNARRIVGDLRTMGAI